MDEPIRVLGGLYISSVNPLLEGTDLHSLGIDHIVSVQKDLIPDTYKNYDRLQIPVDDLPEEDLFKYFGVANRFIEKGLHGEAQGKVLVHCNAGRSRSVAIVIAYLMHKFNLGYKEARYAVVRRYPKGTVLGPNKGFQEQLLLYKECGCTDNLEELDAEYPKYRQWKQARLTPTNVADSYREIQRTSDYVLRCKKCGQVLADSSSVIPHEPPTDDDDKQKFFVHTAFYTGEVIGVQKASGACTQFFVEPVKWMKQELDKGELEGLFHCFKCGSKVGGYHWQGSRCSCGRWVNPGMHLQLAKVDRIVRK